MSRFNLEGKLGFADALVGTFPAEAKGEIDQTFILVLLREGIPAKKILEIKEQINLHAAQGFQQWDQTSDVSGLFNRLSQNNICTMTIEHAGPSAAMIDLALDQKKPKNIIYCTNTEAYLAICSRFGISREQMASIAELKELLPQKKINTASGAVGVAHKLCELMAQGKGKLIMPSYIDESDWPRLRSDQCSPLIKSILVAPKFDCGYSEYVGSDREDHLAKEIYDGNKNYLPFEQCVFEYKGDKNYYVYLARRERGKSPVLRENSKGDTSFYCTVFVVPKNFSTYVMMPYAIDVDSLNGTLIQFGTGYVTPNNVIKKRTMDLIREHKTNSQLGKMICHVSFALQIFNSPDHKPEILEVPEGLKKSREKKRWADPTKFPFFDYHVLRADEFRGQESYASRNVVRRGTGMPSLEETGIHQRYHQRSGYARTFTNKDGTEEVRIVSDYWAGDPRLGIIRKNRELVGPTEPSPELEHT
jgi:hypothetical protein